MDKWIIVNLGHDGKRRNNVRKGYLSILDELTDWFPIVLGDDSLDKHGCKSCINVNNSQGRHDDLHQEVFTAISTAIQNGAHYIYFMTSLHDVKTAILRMTQQNSKGLVFTAQVPFKPCTHFAAPLLGQGNLFPHCHDHNWLYHYKTGDYPERTVTSFCQDCDKDVHLLSTNRSHKIYCDRNAPNIAVNAWTFSYTFFENTLWSYESFWALYYYGLKELVTSKDGYLPFSLMVQRLLWETRYTLSFIRSDRLHNHQKDEQIPEEDQIQQPPVENMKKKLLEKNPQPIFEVEKELCRGSHHGVFLGEMFRHLYRWTCSKPLPMTTCIKMLADEFFRMQVISGEQSRLIKRFNNLLSKSSYDFPERNVAPTASIGSYIGSKANFVWYWPSPKDRRWNQNPFHDYCQKFMKSKNTSNSTHGQTQSASIKNGTVNLRNEYILLQNNQSVSQRSDNVSDNPIEVVKSAVVLVVVFRSSDASGHIQMTNFFDFMYGRHFRHIVYCTSGAGEFHSFASVYPQPMTAIDLKETDPALFSYVCMSEAMRMYHRDVKGYLHIESDTLLNPWAVTKLSNLLHKPWINDDALISTKLNVTEVKSPYERHRNIWRDRPHGRRALNNAMVDLLHISQVITKHLAGTNTSSNRYILQYLTKYNKVLKKFLTGFNETKLSNFKIHIGDSLLYYIPTALRDTFIILSDEFSRYKVHSDIFVPMVVNSLDKDFLKVKGSVLDTRFTGTTVAAFSDEAMLLHPWEMKLMPVFLRSKFMCEIYLPLVEKSLVGQ